MMRPGDKRWPRTGRPPPQRQRDQMPEAEALLLPFLRRQRSPLLLPLLPPLLMWSPSSSPCLATLRLRSKRSRSFPWPCGSPCPAPRTRCRRFPYIRPPLPGRRRKSWSRRLTSIGRPCAFLRATPSCEIRSAWASFSRVGASRCSGWSSELLFRWSGSSVWRRQAPTRRLCCRMRPKRSGEIAMLSWRLSGRTGAPSSSQQPSSGRTRRW
mmetsp:Transcript_124677/g.278255  ORF Transcript_124677/g.278255 Transcript_124677/m.278255 type:complete len:211 (+) Transcript_124677:438-1070(+)